MSGESAVWMAEIRDVTGETVYVPCASREDAVAWLSEDAGVDLESVPECPIGAQVHGYYRIARFVGQPESRTNWTRSGCDFFTVELVPLYRKEV